MSSVYLAHHGIKGMRWGIRQWQNPDGSLTPAGRIRYGAGAAVKAAGSAAKTVGKATGAVVKTTGKAVGSAAKTVGKAVRKKVAPTDAELDEQIEAEKSKIRHKEKKEELKRLKETGKIENPDEQVGHKKYSQMSDKEVNDRIARLKKEAELADLELTRNLSPGKRMVLNALKEGASKGISVATQTAITKLGKKFSDNLLKDDSDDKSNKSDDKSDKKNKTNKSDNNKSDESKNNKKASNSESKKSSSGKNKSNSKKSKVSKNDGVKIRLVSNGREDERFWNRAKKTVGSVRFRKKSSSNSSSTALAIRR